MRPTRPAAFAAALLVAVAVSAPAYAQPAPSPEPPPGPPPAPKNTIDADGTYAVGVDIVPGTYASAGPIPDGTACYWKRVSGDKLVDNAMTKKAQVVRIEAGDTAFSTNDCQPWSLTNQAPPAQAGPQDLLGQLGSFIGPAILGGGGAPGGAQGGAAPGGAPRGAAPGPAPGAAPTP